MTPVFHPIRHGLITHQSFSVCRTYASFLAPAPTDVEPQLEGAPVAAPADPLRSDLPVLSPAPLSDVRLATQGPESMSRVWPARLLQGTLLSGAECL